MTVPYVAGYHLGRIISKVVFRIKTQGQENVPKEGGFILASNHISFYDPNLVGGWIRRECCFMAKKELFANRLFAAVLRSVNAMPLNRQGFDRQAIKISLEKIDQGYGLVVFPEGTRSRTGVLKKPKTGVGMLARHAECPIVPTYIQGPNRLKDCFLGRFPMRISYGKPLSAEWVASLPKDKEGYQAIATEVMARITSLKEDIRSVK